MYLYWYLCWHTGRGPIRPRWHTYVYILIFMLMYMYQYIHTYVFILIFICWHTGRGPIGPRWHTYVYILIFMLTYINICTHMCLYWYLYVDTQAGGLLGLEACQMSPVYSARGLCVSSLNGVHTYYTCIKYICIQSPLFLYVIHMYTSTQRVVFVLRHSMVYIHTVHMCNMYVYFYLFCMWFMCIRLFGAWSLCCVTEWCTYILHLCIIYVYTISFVLYVIHMYTSTQRVVFVLRLWMVYIHTILT